MIRRRFILRGRAGLRSRGGALVPCLLLVAALAVGALLPSAASALGPWWHLTSGARPSHLQVGGSPTNGGEGPADGELYVTAENVGDAAVDGAGSPVALSDLLPPGLRAVGIEATKPFKEGGLGDREPLSCSLQTLTCALDEPLAPYDQIEMRIAVEVEPGAYDGERNRVSVSGGGAPAQAIERPLTISSAPVRFGVESYEMAAEEEGGGPALQAGSHPFQLNATLAFDQLADIDPVPAPGFKPEVDVPALAKDLSLSLPPGLLGNPTPIPRCTTTQFFEIVGSKENACPPASAVGVVVATVHEPATIGTATLTEPLFNLEPRSGEPARFGFYVVNANTPVFLDTAVRTGGDYGIEINVANLTQAAAILSVEVTFWGIPGDPRHDGQRGWGCVQEARGVSVHAPCEPLSDDHPEPFLTLPTSCSAAPQTSLQTDSWSSPGSPVGFAGRFEPATPPAGCDRLGFSPELKLGVDRQQASSPTGVTIDVHVPRGLGGEADGGLASASMRSMTIELPPGVGLNLSAADGLQGCTEGQAGLLPGLGGQGEELFTSTLSQSLCPDPSKIGTAVVRTPLLPAGQPLEGGLYLATPASGGEAGKNPFDSLLALYLLAEDPISGTIVKLAGEARLDPVTGEVAVTFENDPQLPFEDIEMHLFDGERAPLTTPATCGTKAGRATFTPWSGGPAVESGASFTVTAGPGGGPCPATQPFSPSLSGGSAGDEGGSFAALAIAGARDPADQQIQGIELHLPNGLLGDLKGVELCPGAEADAGTCAPNSLIGHVSVSAGLGADPFSLSGGEIFLTAGYGGAPLGLSILIPAIAGPFDLGTVVVRARLEVDPRTAALSVFTDPSGRFAIPHILDGIPLQIRDLSIAIDRPGFALTPSGCAPEAIAGEFTSIEGATATASTPYRASSCARLKFAPRLTARVSARRSKARGVGLRLDLSFPTAAIGTHANLAMIKLSLPRQLPSRLTTLQRACPARAFAVSPASCPRESAVGSAKAITPLLPAPLAGPVYLVSHGSRQLPELVVVLRGFGITVELAGQTEITDKTTTATFKAIPDAPIASLQLNLPDGRFSVISSNANLCKSKLSMPTELQAQNGAVVRGQTKISVAGCPTARQRLARALAACARKRDRARRRACEVWARERAGAKRGKRGAGRH